MKCEAVRDRMADYLDGRVGVLTTGRIRRHLETCSACGASLRDEEALNGALAAWEDQEPSGAVWLRIRDAVGMQTLPDAPPVPWWVRVRGLLLRQGLPYAVGAATTAVLLLALGVGRTPTSVPATVPQEPGISGEALDGEYVPGDAAAAGPREGEQSLIPVVAEDESGGVLLIRGSDFRELIRRYRREGLLPEDWQDEPAVRPASHGEKTH